MKLSDLTQIKTFLDFLSKKHTTPEANAVIADFNAYLDGLSTTRVDGRSYAWPEERREAQKDFWAKKREAKTQANMVWLWNYDNEPPTQITREEAGALVKKSAQHITKQLNEHGGALLPVPGQFRAVCITLTNEPQALHYLLQRTEGQLAKKPGAKKTK